MRIGDALAPANVLDGIGDAVAGDAVLRHRIGDIGVALVENSEKDVFGADVFVAESIRFFIGAVDDALEARRDKNLVGALPIDGRRARAAPQDIIHARAQRADINRQPFQDLRHDAVCLFQQRQQHMLGIHLGVGVAMQDFIGAGGGVLRAFGEAVESDHAPSFLAAGNGSLSTLDQHLLYSGARFSHGAMAG